MQDTDVSNPRKEAPEAKLVSNTSNSSELNSINYLTGKKKVTFKDLYFQVKVKPELLRHLHCLLLECVYSGPRRKWSTSTRSTVTAALDQQYEKEPWESNLFLQNMS